jgi:hypothetical protein
LNSIKHRAARTCELPVNSIAGKKCRNSQYLLFSIHNQFPKLNIAGKSWTPGAVYNQAMAAKKKSTNDAEKLACHERVIEILEDRLALERHMRRNKASDEAILFAREDAYVNLVRAVLGLDALYLTETETPKSPRPHRRRPTQKSDQSERRSTPRKQSARTIRVHRSA